MYTEHKAFTDGVVFVRLYGGDMIAGAAALTQCKLWAIDRSVFKTILTRTGMQKHADHVEFLKRFDDHASPRLCTEV